MSREDFIKEKIKEKGYTIKDFAIFIDMPYSTLLSILKGSVGGAAIDNVLKICAGLNISIDELQKKSNEKSPLTYKGRELCERDLLMLSLFQQIPEDKQSAFLDAFEILLRTSGVIE